MSNAVKTRKNSKRNKIEDHDKSFHDWYRFVLSYPPHLVNTYLEKFSIGDNSVVFDPFCGTGTTLVEAKLQNVTSIGLEASPFCFFSKSRLEY